MIKMKFRLHGVKTDAKEGITSNNRKRFTFTSIHTCFPIIATNGLYKIGIFLGNSFSYSHREVIKVKEKTLLPS